MALPLTPAQRSLRARIAAHALHAQGKTNCSPANRAFLAKFEREVDPDGILPPEERAQRAVHARRQFMAALSLKASRACAEKLRNKELAEIESDRAEAEAATAKAGPVV